MSVTLVDTQALLWLLDSNPKLSRLAIEVIAEPAKELFFSYASVWEITIKYGKKKLALPEPPELFLLKHLSVNKIRLLPISLHSIFLAGTLPRHHRDPFDRLIVAQCLYADLTVVSHDRQLDAYGVRRVW